MKIEVLHQLFLKSEGISTDTRKIGKNSIFFGLKGDNFNGNNFAREALEKGASYAVIDEEQQNKNEKFVLVKNVLETLQELAKFHRKFLRLPVLAITGSNGKTTTKELINAVLSKKYRTVATRGNLNNHIGVPLTLLSMTKETEIGIVEMGANHPGEIALLSNICLPDYGYITNFGKAHLEGFKNIEGVIAAKGELYQFLKNNNKTTFLNIDDPVQKKQISTGKNFSFGGDKQSDINISYLTEREYATIYFEGREISGKLTGSYNAINMAAAFAIGYFFKVDHEDTISAIENYTPQNNRSQILTKGTNKIFLDAYNANPTSMAAALENFKNQDHNKKMVILGDMFELGADSEKEHQALVYELERSGIKKIYLIGNNFFKTSSNENIGKFSSFEDFKMEFSDAPPENYLILIKGSRGMALERVLDLL